MSAPILLIAGAVLMLAGSLLLATGVGSVSRDPPTSASGRRIVAYGTGALLLAVLAAFSLLAAGGLL